ncbi:polysaccharide deacetylase family protein [Pseudonocardia hispaniensis]|uniref:Polysaccharide deacetylase family protein n=1 Tax=Pseudonocardia hispaniensis TaxID=904933 RepID=A0ABW1J311_9PSEU
MSEMVGRKSRQRTRLHGGRCPLILMYHSVAPYDHDPYLVTVRPQRFDEQLRWLRRRGLRGTSVGELLGALRAGTARGLVGLTFDDGYADFVDHVLPLLRRYRFTASVYVVAGRIGGYNAWDDAGTAKPLLTAEQVATVAAAGMEIGSHGLWHTSLTSGSAAQRQTELLDSRWLLQEVSGQDVAGFCYPYGDVDAAAVSAVRAAGYRYACAIRPSRLSGVHALPRTYIGDRDRTLRLLAKRCRHRIGTAMAIPDMCDS